jgi:hypothetical protein
MVLSTRYFARICMFCANERKFQVINALLCMCSVRHLLASCPTPHRARGPAPPTAHKTLSQPRIGSISDWYRRAPAYTMGRIRRWAKCKARKDALSVLQVCVCALDPSNWTSRGEVSIPRHTEPANDARVEHPARWGVFKNASAKMLPCTKRVLVSATREAPAEVSHPAICSASAP